MVLLDGHRIQLLDCGDSAVRVAVTGPGLHQRWQIAHRIAMLLDASAPCGVTNTLPTYDAVLVEFDCLRTEHHSVRTAIEAVLDRVDSVAPRQPRTFHIPVVYGGEHGPDLSSTASHLGIGTTELIAAHTAGPLLMRCFGAPAGAPMLDGPAFSRPVPRLSSPRSRVPAGAVAVAGRQAVVSSRPAPGGWQVLGTTPVSLVDPSHQPLSPYWPGDFFQFFAIDAAEFNTRRGVLQ